MLNLSISLPPNGQWEGGFAGGGGLETLGQRERGLRPKWNNYLKNNL